MAGIGPPPKDPSKRARRNADPVPRTVLRFESAVQPALPAEWDWPDVTQNWWLEWGASPQAEHFMATDWLFLLDTAHLHADFWKGDRSVAGELRLRLAKFGATLEDRARLRMACAAADDADSRRPATSPATERYGGLRVIRPDQDDGKDASG